MANPVQSGPGATGTIMPTLLPVRLAIVVGALIIMGSMGACGINPTVTVRSPTPRVHYCYNADTCPKKDETVSDSPPRAFRNASGIVHLYSSESRGARALVGTDLNGSNFPGLAGPVSTRDCNVFYAIALQNLWRDTFQYQAQRLRKKGACSLCRRCGVGGWTCERHPDCESDEKTPVRLPHSRVCHKCPHHKDYKETYVYDDVKKALEDCEPLY